MKETFLLTHFNLFVEIGNYDFTEMLICNRHQKILYLKTDLKILFGRILK